ncbi:transcriptional regulatory protein [Paramyrothecium foliicola]|nr:transcriptional regulatory protein [Paramyrothecium foliicola]
MPSIIHLVPFRIARSMRLAEIGHADKKSAPIVNQAQPPRRSLAILGFGLASSIVLRMKDRTVVYTSGEKILRITNTARRVGCDKSVPQCHNCIRSGRECLGYGIRLKWPEIRDGRRRADEMHVHVLSSNNPLELSQDYGIHFLNTTDRDVTFANQDGLSQAVQDIAISLSTPVQPGRALTNHPQLDRGDSMLLSYYEGIISPMVSTLHVQNGFQSELLPMVLSGRDAGTTSLCNAMMAVSAVHNRDAQAALPFKVQAIRSLSESLLVPDGQTPRMTVVQAAAAMMLCVYSVFDDRDGNWHTHLDGAKWLINVLCQTKALQTEFLLTWFMYHEVMGCFTQPSRQLPSWLSPRVTLEYLEFDMTRIVGSVGCSMEVFEIIDQVNNLRALSIRHAEQAKKLTSHGRSEFGPRLENLVQKLDPTEEESITSMRKVQILATAELYRLAAQMYLYRVCPSLEDDECIAVLLEQALATINQLPIVTSPWPVFIVACESKTDAHRICMLSVLDIMSQARKIGNLNTMRAAIESYWKQYDLQADAAVEKTVPWWLMFDDVKPVPWFV